MGNSPFDQFIDSLPAPELARRFLQGLEQGAPETFLTCSRDPRQLANLAVMASYSPFLADLLLQRPELVEWLWKQRDLDRVKSLEDLGEDLARFAAMSTGVTEGAILNRFKRRELLRIYLRDCLGRATLAETTLELSTLADAILSRALWRVNQTLTNELGVPQILDAQGKARKASFTIVAVGKLGSQELNYASDIDLVYVFEGEGSTTGGGFSNREFFNRLAERITGMAGGLTDEGAAYRIDLRLRPYGSQGALAVSLDEAVKYYRVQAANWERLSLLRARCSAGDVSIVERLLRFLRDRLYPQEPLPQVLNEVRESKARIERQSEREAKGTNIKLDRGGIRDIEFIVHALQIYHGGADRWIRVPQILIGLQRLADRGWLDDHDRTALASAYTFLRTLEHRLQMEFGQRTHTLPVDPARLSVLARRMGYPEDPRAAGDVSRELRRPATAMVADLQTHRRRVADLFHRTFSEAAVSDVAKNLEQRVLAGPPTLLQALRSLTEVLSGRRLLDRLDEATLRRWCAGALNADRAIRNMTAFLDAVRRLHATDRLESNGIAGGAELFSEPLGEDQIRRAFLLLANSSFFAPFLISHPRLVSAVEQGGKGIDQARDPVSRFAEAFRVVEDDRFSLPEAMNELRRRWLRELVWIGGADVDRAIDLARSNLLQTSLAQASLGTAVLLAQRTLERGSAHQKPVLPRFALLALGRLAHRGIDYGSDLDLVCVYDEKSPAGEQPGHRQLARLVERVIEILSSATREGTVYRVDLRLRPDGTIGSLARSSSAFLSYARAAPAWERMAYLKLRPVAGDAEFGQQVCEACQSIILDHAANSGSSLGEEVRDVRARLEKEKAALDRYRHVKHGFGGMMDVYFVTRYLQLRNRIREPEAPGTGSLIDRLLAAGALNERQCRVLREGYAFLRRVDHSLRLIFDTRRPVLPANRQRLAELARWMDLGSGSELEKIYQGHTQDIRAVFEETISDQYR